MSGGELVSSMPLAKSVPEPLEHVPRDVWQVDMDDPCKTVAEVLSLAASCAYTLQMMLGTRVRAESTATSVGGSIADASKPVRSA